MKVWITKYALSKGIFEIDTRIITRGKYTFARLGGICDHYTREFVETKEQAIDIARKMRVKKIANLRKKITKLQKMVWA